MMMAALEGLRNALAALPGVATCRIGLEANITPEDYPLIRVVPSRVSDASVIGKSRAEVLIYFGMPIAPFDDTPDTQGRVRLEKLYAALFDMESAVREALATQGGVYRETITDEDRLETYKVMAVRGEVEG